MGRGIAVSAARRVRHAVSGHSIYAVPAMLKQPETYDYDRVGLPTAESRPTRAIRLGAKNRVRIAGLQAILKTPRTIISRLRASYGKLRETAKETNVSVYDIFVANQMLGQICATPLRAQRKKPAVPIAAAPRNSKVSNGSKVPPPKSFRVGSQAPFKRR